MSTSYGGGPLCGYVVSSKHDCYLRRAQEPKKRNEFLRRICHSFRSLLRHGGKGRLSRQLWSRPQKNVTALLTSGGCVSGNVTVGVELGLPGDDWYASVHARNVVGDPWALYCRHRAPGLAGGRPGTHGKERAVFRLRLPRIRCARADGRR